MKDRDETPEISDRLARYLLEKFIAQPVHNMPRDVETLHYIRGGLALARHLLQLYEEQNNVELEVQFVWNQQAEDPGTTATTTFAAASRASRGSGPRQHRK